MSLAKTEAAPAACGAGRAPAVMADVCRAEGGSSVVAQHCPDTTASRGFLPMPDLVVRVAQIRNRIAADGLDARNHLARMEPPLRRVLGDVMDLHTFVDQISGVAGQPRRLHLLPAAERQTRAILRGDAMIDRVAADKHGEVPAGTLHDRGQPEDGIVLLL